MICEPAFARGACADQGNVFCGATSAGSCCPAAQPYYCSTSNLCYSTAQQAAAACPQAGCVACASQVSGTCSAAPTGGSCIGYPGYLFCGGICCPSTLPYYCSTANLCYPTAGQAAAACPDADCLQCASTCVPPPATLPTGGGDGICGNEQPLAAIDGIAAYAMCDAALTGNVWSDNGTATAAMSEGAGWVETQTGIVGSSGNGGYQCTELATRYFYFKFGVCPWISSAGRTCATDRFRRRRDHGDARARRSAVFPPGCNGADAITGHVAVVDQVTTTAVSVVQEHSGTAGTGTYARSCLSCFLHATANSGTP